MIQDTAQVVAETTGNGIGAWDAFLVLVGYGLGELRVFLARKFGKKEPQGKKL